MKQVLIVAILGLSVAGCVTPEAVAAKDSAIEGVPVPIVARPYPMNGTRREDLRIDAYRSVEMSFDELDAWYEQHMPKGRSWKGWRWQDPIPGRMYVTRSYCRADRDAISVTIVREESGNPPSILVTQDGSGSGC